MGVLRKARRHGRTALLVVVVGAAGAATAPALSDATSVGKSQVTVVNQANEPVPIKANEPLPVDGTVTIILNESMPVEVRGTAQVAGTVTLANQPQPIQRRSILGDIARGQCCIDALFFTVPEGKILTIDYAEVTYIAPAELDAAELNVGCRSFEGENVQAGRVNLPVLDTGGKTVAGGPLTLHVPGGGCLTVFLRADVDELPEDRRFSVLGAFSGHLTDAP